MKKLPDGTIGIIIEKNYLSGWQIKVDTFGGQKVSKAKFLGHIKTWEELINAVEQYCEEVKQSESILIDKGLFLND